MAQTTLNQRAKQASRPQRVEVWRLWAMLIFFTLFGLYNLFTVFKLQVLQFSNLSTMAEQRITWTDTILPRRGLIYDSRGQLLAGNTTANDVYIDKTHLTTDADLHSIVDLFAPVIGQDPNTLFTNLKQASGLNIKVANRVDDATTAKVNDFKKQHPEYQYTVSLDPQPLRQYPAYGPDGKSGLAASLLGFADYDNQGHYGVEEYYNTELAGTAGWIDAERDANGRPLALEQAQTQAAVDGSDLTLTIDSGIQYLVEKELQASLKEFQADNGYAIVQDPSTGAILAMANYPTFDANQFNKVSASDYGIFKNPAVNDVHEPGSTMKILTYSSSIDAHAVMSTTSFYAKACIPRYGTTICNATFTEWGDETMLQGLARSDNIAAIYAAEQLGPDKYFNYLKNFGIGQRTGIDLAGEVAGLTHWPDGDDYSPLDFDEIAFGQTDAVTPIQLITAASAVANGGTLLKPYVMKEISKDGQVLEEGKRTEVRRVVSPQAAADVADMMAWGVENGGVAHYAHIPGYHVSVKTGTAQIAINGVYQSSGSLASAMGWGPSINPRFTLYIAFMNPKTSQWGENTASVSWGRLAQQILMYMKVQPTEPIPTPTATP